MLCGDPWGQGTVRQYPGTPEVFIPLLFLLTTILKSWHDHRIRDHVA